MSAPPRIIAADKTLGDALSLLIGERDLFALCASGRQRRPTSSPAGEAGIITERDVLRALAIEGEGALKLPVEQFMSKPLAAIPAEAFVYRAIGAHEPAENPPSRRHRRRRHSGRRTVGARPVAVARRRGGCARRRDRRSRGRACARPRLGEAAACRGLAAGRRRCRARHRRRHLARARRADAAGRGAGGTPHAGGRARARRPVLMRSPCSVRPAAAKACSRWTRTMRWCSRDGEPDGSRGPMVRDARQATSPTSCTRSACPIARAASWRATRNGAARSRPGATRIADWIGALAAAGSAFGRYLLRSARRARAVWRLRIDLWRHGLSMPRNGKADFAKLAGRKRAGEVERGVGLFGGIRTSQRPHRPEDVRACSGSCPARARWRSAIMLLERATPARLARHPARSSIGGEADLDALVEAQGLFPRTRPRPAARRYPGRQPADECGRGQAADSVREREPLAAARCRRSGISTN